MGTGEKRKADDGGTDERNKRPKTKKQWQVPRKNDHGAIQSRILKPGDSGIWATCNRGREAKCVGELRDFFTEYAEELYGEQIDSAADDVDEEAVADIENDIQHELDGMRKPVAAAQLFTPVRMDAQCLVFFKTRPPVEPVSFVQRICEDAMANPQRKRTRHVQRLSPVTLMSRASEEGLDTLASEVLAPHFHQEPVERRKFAIRPTLRNHKVLKRDSIIKRVASAVGPEHHVDLKNYDLLILVEVYQHICGMSVVSDKYEKLKRFNLAEIYEPTPRAVEQPNEQPKEGPKTQLTELSLVEKKAMSERPDGMEKE